MHRIDADFNKYQHTLALYTAIVTLKLDRKVPIAEAITSPDSTSYAQNTKLASNLIIITKKKKNTLLLN